MVELILMEIVTASLERDNLAAGDWHERVTCYGTYNVQETLSKMDDLASTISSFCRFVERTECAVVLEVGRLTRLDTVLTDCRMHLWAGGGVHSGSLGAKLLISAESGPKPGCL